jgi:hypothetical protein
MTWSTPRPGRFTPGKDQVPIVQEAGWAPGPDWACAKNSAPNRDSIPGPSNPQPVATPTELSRTLSNSVQFVFLYGIHVFAKELCVWSCKSRHLFMDSVIIKLSLPELPYAWADIFSEVLISISVQSRLRSRKRSWVVWKKTKGVFWYAATAEERSGFTA